MNINRLKQLSAADIARIVLYALLALVVVMFGLFYLVGYNHPFDENPEYNAPELSGALVTFTLVFVVLTAVVWLSAVVVGIKRRNKAVKESHRASASRIAIVVGAITLAVLIITFALGSSSPMIINRATYDSVFWLKAADMFINSIIAMLVFAAIVLAYGMAKRSGGKGK